MNFSSATATQLSTNFCRSSWVGRGSCGKEPSIWVMFIFSPVAIMRKKAGLSLPSLIGTCSNFLVVLWSNFSAPLPMRFAARETLSARMSPIPSLRTIFSSR